MQTKKMSLANIQGKLSRTEMKNIMAGSGSGGGCRSGGCGVYSGGTTYWGQCTTFIHGVHAGSSPSTHCMCWTNEVGHYISTNNYAACSL